MLWLPTWRSSALLPVISQTPLMLAAAATSARPLLSSTRPLLLMLPAVMAASPSSSVAPLATLIWPLDWLRRLPLPVRPNVPALTCTLPVLLKP